MMACQVPPSTQSLRGRMGHDVPLARHTAWRIGGPAQRLYQPAVVIGDQYRRPNL